MATNSCNQSITIYDSVNVTALHYFDFDNKRPLKANTPFKLMLPITKTYRHVDGVIDIYLGRCQIRGKHRQRKPTPPRPRYFQALF